MVKVVVILGPPKINVPVGWIKGKVLYSFRQAGVSTKQLKSDKIGLILKHLYAHTPSNPNFFLYLSGNSSYAGDAHMVSAGTARYFYNGIISLFPVSCHLSHTIVFPFIPQRIHPCIHNFKQSEKQMFLFAFIH